MKKLLYVIGFLGFLSAQGKVAVMPFVSIGIEEIGIAFSNKLEIELFNENHFQVLDRNNIEDILKEQGLQYSGLSNESVVEIGNLIGVDYIITGSIARLSFFYFFVTAKMLSVESGEIVSVAEINEKIRARDLVKFGPKYIAQELSGKKSDVIDQYLTARNKTIVREEKKEISNTLIAVVITIVLTILFGLGTN